MRASKFFLGIILIICNVATFSYGANQSITRAEAHELGKKIELGFARGDLRVLNEVIDLDALLDRALLNFPATFKDAQSFRAGFKSGFSKGTYIRMLESASSFKFLRVLDGAEPRLTFRLLTAEGGLNYYEFILKRDQSNRIRIVDFYVYLMGELMSQSIRRLAYLEISGREKTSEDLFPSPDVDFVKYQPEVRHIIELLKRKEHQKLLAAYRRLPATLQREKFLLQYRLIAAMNCDPGDYAQAIAMWEKNYPGDPSLPLITLDGYVMRKDHQKAIKAIERIDKHVGGDPYLKAIGAGQYRLRGQIKKAVAMAHEVLKAEPELEVAYHLLLACALEQKDYSEVVRLFTKIEEIFKTDVVAMAKDLSFNEFRNSPAYHKWIKSRKTP